MSPDHFARGFVLAGGLVIFSFVESTMAIMAVLFVVVSFYVVLTWRIEMQNDLLSVTLSGTPREKNETDMGYTRKDILITDDVMKKALLDIVAPHSESAHVDRLVDYTSCSAAAFREAVGEAELLPVSVSEVLFLELTTTGTVDFEWLERDLNGKMEKCLNSYVSRPGEFSLSSNHPSSVEILLVQPAAFLRLRTFMLDKMSPSEIKDSKGILHDSPDLIRFLYAERQKA